MSSKEEVHRAAERGDAEGVAKMLDEGEAEVGSKDKVSVYVCFGCSSWCCLG